MSEYDNVARGSLKLKGVSDHKIKKKKKKKDKEKELSKMYENIASHASTSETTDGETRKIQVDKRTKAEIAFEQAKEKKRAEQILERASKTHKERIMEFNQHLDNLTEHFDIPKVSWTK